MEITQKGLRQVQINKKAGIDFALVMRAFLRADPDIIMVGESRDKETVSMGVEASLTGHLVFSTLHTNSAPESITRLLDMGMDPFNFADALLGILAQRLAKRLCDCKEAYAPTHEELRSFIAEYALDLRQHRRLEGRLRAARRRSCTRTGSRATATNGQLRFYRAVGCDKCNKSGYKGRVGLHELLVGRRRDQAAGAGTRPRGRHLRGGGRRRHAHAEDGRDGEDHDGADGPEAGAVGVYQVMAGPCRRYLIFPVLRSLSL